MFLTESWLLSIFFIFINAELKGNPSWGHDPSAPCEYSIMAIMPSFQVGYAGSIPVTRSF